jgi:hypothetical protein
MYSIKKFAGGMAIFHDETGESRLLDQKEKASAFRDFPSLAHDFSAAIHFDDDRLPPEIMPPQKKIYHDEINGDEVYRDPPLEKYN